MSREILGSRALGERLRAKRQLRSESRMDNNTGRGSGRESASTSTKASVKKGAELRSVGNSDGMGAPSDREF